MGTSEYVWQEDGRLGFWKGWCWGYIILRKMCEWKCPHLGGESRGCSRLRKQSLSEVIATKEGG